MTPLRKAHFIGIGGIGISSLAQLFHHDGWNISGTNDEPSPYTLDRIEALGVKIFYEPDIKHIDKDTDLIVYSSAWDGRAPEFMEEVRSLGIPVKSYFEALGDVSKGKRTVAVAGTHGKTTTTGMLARILRDAGVSPTAVVGSVVKDFDSNYLLGNSDIFVAEACEYYRHFLELDPEVLVITNIELDHTDYYKDLADVQSAFRALAEKVPAHGVIVTDATHPNIASVLEGLTARVVDYTKEPGHETRFPGEYNKMNARAAAAASRIVAPENTDESIAASLAAFEGTWRRFEYKGKTVKGADVYDDYAHHPTAVRKTVAELRAKASGRVFVAFHPHLFSRTRDLLDDFSTAFRGADKVFIAPIYAAREVDDGTVSNEILAARIQENGVDAVAATFDEIRDALQSEATEGDIIMTMGAGDIYKIADQLVQGIDLNKLK